MSRPTRILVLGGGFGGVYMEGTTHFPRPGSGGFLLKLRIRYRTMPRRIDSCINDQIDAAFRLFLLLVNGRRRNRQLGSARWEALTDSWVKSG